MLFSSTHLAFMRGLATVTFVFLIALPGCKSSKQAGGTSASEPSGAGNAAQERPLHTPAPALPNGKSHESGPTSTQASTDDLTGAIDPYDGVMQRTLFMKAAGPDGMLSEAEFTIDAKTGRGFARRFDTWIDMVQFDEDHSSSIDWSEAKAYRKAQREHAFNAYDADQDGRLAGKERLAAIASLMGEEVAAQPQAPTTAAASEAPPQTRLAVPAGVNPAARTEFLNTYGKLGDPSEMVKEFDTDGDGVLSKDELKAGKEQVKQAMVKVYDVDGNGSLSRKERRAAMADLARENSIGVMTRYDVNRNGKLDAGEQAAYNKDRQEQSNPTLR